MQPASPISEIQFRNPRLAPVGVEVMNFDFLRRHARASLIAPQRPAFHLLALIESGRGAHTVDFVDHLLQPRTVLWVRAGQVQQWRMNAKLQGPVVLIADRALAPSIARGAVDMQLLDLDGWPTRAQLSDERFRAATAAIDRLHAELERFGGAELDAALVWHSVLLLLLGLARELRSAQPVSAHTNQARIHRMFARELESRFSTRTSVQELAARIGYSESTLSRACVAVTGRTAKALLDRRIALEAKRLLIHSASTVAQIGHQLGFSEPTNFVKFFVRTTGTTPQRFRAGG